MELNIRCFNEEETAKLGTCLAELAEPGDVYLLEGELGAGKTTFTKGVAAALGIKRTIKSPTYTLIREYTEGRLPLYHMDLYRLDEEEAEELGLEEYFEGTGVTMVEWASLAPDELPDHYLKIQISRTENGENEREFRFTANGSRYERLLEELSR